MKITKDFASGGSGLGPNSGGPSLATALRDIADDLNGVQVGAVTSPNATDLASALTLLNEIKAALNAVAAGTYTLKTTKG